MSRTKQLYSCAHCEKEFKAAHSSTKTYCSVQCQQDKQFKDRYTAWMSGEQIKIGRSLLRRMIEYRDGYFCNVCGISTWNDQKIVLDAEHIDGNSNNNSPDNVCFLCPNCHSQTETYKAKNKGNGRWLRRQRYAEGKSF